MIRSRFHRQLECLLLLSATGLLLHLGTFHVSNFLTACEATADGTTIFSSRFAIGTDSESTSISKARIVIPRVLLPTTEREDGSCLDNIDDDWAPQSLSSPFPSSIKSILEDSLERPDPELTFQRRRLQDGPEQQRSPSFLSSAVVPPVSPLLFEDGGPNVDPSTSSPPQSLLRHTKKTGTTIAGCVVQGGGCVILAADTRATENTMVADKTCSKIHPLATNAWCCGAGTSADLDKLTRTVLYTKALEGLSAVTIGNGSDDGDGTGDEDRGDDADGDERLASGIHDASATATDRLEVLFQQQHNSNSGSDPHGEALIFVGPVPIDAICNMFQDTLFESQGNLGANLVLGGVWGGRAFLRAIHPHGSMDVDLPFAALGSGGLAAMGVLEEGYRPDLTLEEGVTLVQRAILSGIRNDLGSGSQVDLCVIYPDGTSRHTRCAVPEETLRDVPLLRGDDGKTTKEDAFASAEGGRGRSMGVNGFGNTPFAIESTKQRVVSIASSEERRKKEWNKILGVPDVQ
jgi:20S proteasome subunit beta 2